MDNEVGTTLFVTGWLIEGFHRICSILTMWLKNFALNQKESFVTLC